jgi:hypothetical protein
MRKACFYICSVCFEISDACREHHGSLMVCCDVEDMDDERRKPVVDAAGHLVSRAPRWYLEGVGWLPGDQQPGPPPDPH